MLTFRKWIRRGTALLGLALVFGVGTGRAEMVTFVTPTGSTESGGNAVNAEATFTTSTDTVSVTLTNLLVNPKTVAQNLSDLFFTTNNESLTSGTLASSSGQEVTVKSDGSTDLGGTVATGWVLSFDSSTGFHLNDLAGPGHAGPAHTIIGAPDAFGVYSHANPSIAGNGPHNPFLNQTATFTVSIAGVTSATKITSATFSFGTAAGNNVTGAAVPEPGSIVLCGIGMAGLGLGQVARSRRRKNAAA